MQARFAYRFLANFGWGTTVRSPSRPKYYVLIFFNVRYIGHTIRNKINDEKNITSISLPVGDTNV